MISVSRGGLRNASHLLLDDLSVDLARGDVVVASKGDVQITLIVAKIQVCLSSIVQDEDLACVNMSETFRSELESTVLKLGGTDHALSET